MTTSVFKGGNGGHGGRPFPSFPSCAGLASALYLNDLLFQASSSISSVSSL